jgi:hypothetical protein
MKMPAVGGAVGSGVYDTRHAHERLFLAGFIGPDCFEAAF